MVNNVNALALLREKCKSLGTNEVGRRAGVSGAYVSMVKSGKRPLAGKLAKFLGLKVERVRVVRHIYRTVTRASER